MKFLFFAAAIILVFFPKALYAQDRVSVMDHAIASPFKILAKGYVATVDLERIKKNQIAHLNKINDEKFKKHFRKASLVLSTLPSEFKIKYGFKNSMTKGDVIEEIARLDKKDINQIIDDIPDVFIAFQFKQYLASLKEDIGQSNVVQKINEFWNKIISQAQK